MLNDSAKPRSRCSECVQSLNGQRLQMDGVSGVCDVFHVWRVVCKGQIHRGFEVTWSGLYVSCFCVDDVLACRRGARTSTDIASVFLKHLQCFVCVCAVRVIHRETHQGRLLPSPPDLSDSLIILCFSFLPL